MSKKAKNENKKRRREAKAARKKANYIRTGPKAGAAGKRAKKSRYNSFIPGQPKDPAPFKSLSAGGKRRAKKKSSNKKHHSSLPLRPLRKRLHLNTVQIAERRSMYGEI